MKSKLIQLTNDLTNFSEETHLDLLLTEYQNKGTLNYLVDAIIPQKDGTYSFDFRYSYYENLLNQISNFLPEEKLIVVLLCLIKSYRENLNDFIDLIMESYNKIRDYNSENRYFNYLKYQLEIQLFSYYTFETEDGELTAFFKTKVDQGNIDFENYN